MNPCHVRRLLVSIPALLAVAAVAACESPAHGPESPGGVAPPIVLSGTGYETAGQTTLAAYEPDNWSDLHNVVHLSENIISGGEPLTDAALERLAAMGVRTLLSVDGKSPNVAKAEELGMRYVHVPIQYSGLDEDEIAGIAKTFRELPAPFYVHCFHGKHRGPAGAAVGRLVLDGAPREQALAEMRQWCGTSKKYEGLFRDIATRPMPDAAASASHDFDFPSTQPFEGLRGAMIGMARANDNLVDLAKRDWVADPAHPDVDAVNEAEKLYGLFHAASSDPGHAAEPDDFRAWMGEAVVESAKLRDALRNLRAGDPAWGTHARTSLGNVRRLCTACHTPYRN